MPSSFLRRSVFRIACLILPAVGALIVSPADSGSQSQGPSKTPAERIDLRPRLVPGQVLEYQIQLQTITDTKRSGAISDPQGPARLSVTWGATVKMEVLAAASDQHATSSNSNAGSSKIGAAKSDRSSSPIRIRTAYEHSAATVKSDTPDPQAEDIEQGYRRLEGQVIEFTVGPDGRVSDIHGLEGVIDDEKVRQGAEQWVAQVSGPALMPGGVALGQTWNSAQPANSMPLAGMIWRSNSTYVRNESCQPAAPAAPAAIAGLCAVIVTRQSVLPLKKLRDPTPEAYRRNGLQTSGQWTGSGESLSYISLRTHLAVSVTQDSSQQIDFTVTNSSGSSIRYAGAIETHSQIALLRSGAGDSQEPPVR